MVEKRETLEKRRRFILKRRFKIILGAIGVFCLTITLLVLWQCTDLLIKIPENVFSSPQQDEWAMFRRDLTHTGNAGANITSPLGTLKWTFDTGAPIHSSPTVVDGTVYFGSRDGNIYALDAATGEQLWAFKTGSWVESSPVLVDGVIYCGSNDSYLYALDAETGEKLWSFKVTYAVRSSPAVADGVVYVGCDDYKVYAVDAVTGSELWCGYTEGCVVSSPAVAKGIVLVGSADGLFYSFHAKNGGARLQYDSKSSFYSSPAVKDGVAYLTDDGSFIAIDIMGRNWWQENKIRLYWNTLYLYGVAPKPSSPSGFLWGIQLGWDIRSVSSPSVVGDYAYVGTGTNLVTINLISHEVVWTFSTNGDVASSPAIAGNVIYVGSEDGCLYAINGTTGEKLWEYTTGDQITSSPAVCDGMVYVGSHDGKLYAFE
jgi:outer membrane protein assembly factor BamB